MNEISIHLWRQCRLVLVCHNCGWRLSDGHAKLIWNNGRQRAAGNPVHQAVSIIHLNCQSLLWTWLLLLKILKKQFPSEVILFDWIRTFYQLNISRSRNNDQHLELWVLYQYFICTIIYAQYTIKLPFMRYLQCKFACYVYVIQNPAQGNASMTLRFSQRCLNLRMTWSYQTQRDSKRFEHQQDTKEKGCTILIIILLRLYLLMTLSDVLFGGLLMQEVCWEVL